MLTAKEKQILWEKAYIPEHLVDYGCAISGMEASIYNNYLFYYSKKHLNLVGYPLYEHFNEEELKEVLEELLEKYRPDYAAIIAPELEEIGVEEEAISAREKDEYLLLETERIKPDKKLRNTLRRASREVIIKEGEYSREHKNLVEEFLRRRKIDDKHKHIFKKLPSYLEVSKTAILLEARKGDRLVAFDVVEFSRDFGFYMFNFMSKKHYVPGACDLLLCEFIERARERGVKKINMGLGVNRGVARFKYKWGAKPWLPYEYVQFSQELIRVLRLSKSLGI